MIICFMVYNTFNSKTNRMIWWIRKGCTADASLKRHHISEASNVFRSTSFILPTASKIDTKRRNNPFFYELCDDAMPKPSFKRD